MCLKIFILLGVVVSLLSGRHVSNSQLSTANNFFGLQLLNQLSDDKSNVFISPFSISTALGMLYSGAKTSTAQEMRQVLGYDLAKLSDQQIKEQFQMYAKQIKELDSSKYELNVANKMVVQKDFMILDSFKNDLVTYFQSNIESVDFVSDGQKVMEEINSWVSRETHNKIPELLSEPLDSSTALVLLNAIYFNGKFQKRFKKNQTRAQKFFSRDHQDIWVQMMNRKGKYMYTEVTELDSQLLEIPYSGDDISLYILLPNQRLKKLRTEFTDFTILDKNIEGLRMRTIDVTLPKFKIETQYSLNGKLSEMEIRKVFTAEADLLGIDGESDRSFGIRVSEVIHKAYIEVSEEGTEAAAVTGCGFTPTSLVIDTSKVIEFRADHPFMFFIRNNVNGMVLFSGHVNQISNILT